MRPLGKAWIVLEEYFHTKKVRLVAILSPKRSNQKVAEYIEQIYVDSFGSFSEKIAFKKNKNTSPFLLPIRAINSTTIRHGHEPMFNAYYAHEMTLQDDSLTFKYKVFSGVVGARQAKEIIRHVPVIEADRTA